MYWGKMTNCQNTFFEFYALYQSQQGRGNTRQNEPSDKTALLPFTRFRGIAC